MEPQFLLPARKFPTFCKALQDLEGHQAPLEKTVFYGQGPWVDLAGYSTHLWKPVPSLTW